MLFDGQAHDQREKRSWEHKANYGAFRRREINQPVHLSLTAKVYGLLSLSSQRTVRYTDTTRTPASSSVRG